MIVFQQNSNRHIMQNKMTCIQLSLQKQLHVHPDSTMHRFLTVLVKMKALIIKKSKTSAKNCHPIVFNYNFEHVHASMTSDYLVSESTLDARQCKQQFQITPLSFGHILQLLTINDNNWHHGFDC